MSSIITRLSGEQWALLGGFLAVIGGQMAAVDSWQQLAQPTNIGAIIVQIGILIRAFHSKTKDSV